MTRLPFSAVTAAPLLGALLLATGCASSVDQTAPAPAQSAPAPAVKLLTYRCESGARVRATYPTDSVALVRYQGETRQLQVVRAASGVRYVNDDLEWWTKGSGTGSTAMLSRRASDDVLERCEQVAVEG
ncbi:hypothetical protein T5B8_01990 [Salinisphaera sp. T5B8]|uniref:MliC family protein n=1 Tax=Salinisphaera sp. T5B8 TaxID=1304154 RepID=UPI00333EE6F4